MTPLAPWAVRCTRIAPYSIGDSYLSELATRENLRHNDIEESSVKFLDSTADYPQAPGVVLIKVPKTMALLEQQLRALRKVVTPKTRDHRGCQSARYSYLDAGAVREGPRPDPHQPGVEESAPDQLPGGGYRPTGGGGNH